MLKESRRVKGNNQKKGKLNSNNRSSRINKLTNKSSIYIINNVIENDDVINSELTETPVNMGADDLCGKNEGNDIYAGFATMLKNPNVIMIPNKAKRSIMKYLPKPLLDKIHGGTKTIKNRQAALELCLLFLCQLSSTYRNIKNGSNPDGWKTLRAEYLRQLLWIDDKTYQNVIKALEYSYQNGKIIECGHHVIGVHSRKYRLGLGYRGKGFEPYHLTTDIVKDLSKKSCERKIRLAENNIICVNLIEFYKTIVLPTEKEIEEEASRLIKVGYRNKKGKILIYRNKKGDGYFKDIDKFCFVEDAMKIFNYLTKNGLLIPRPGNDKSGGRIVDSLVLMPSWIRKLIKISGQPIAEADYSCLHPNIAMTLYGGNSKCLKHEDLAKDLEIDRQTVKVEHLSFFNKNVHQMKISPLFQYYQKHESGMLNAIIAEKQKSEHKHKITSRRLFAKEVQIMTEVISRLNEEAIFVGYVFDALLFDLVHAEKVKEVMDEVASELGVFTVAKI